jgi:choline dehydrogenase
VAYLAPVRSRSNLRIETGARVTKIVFDSGRATGVVYRGPAGDMAVRAAREVILCAGALQSPQLLQLSGVGPRALLDSFAIPIVHDLPGVGENLQDHLQARVIFECTRPITTNDDLRRWWRTLKMGLDYVLTRGGPMAVGINQGGIFARADRAATTPDVQFHVATLSSDMAGSPTHTFPGFTFSVCQLRPESRGRVRIKSADALDAPAMQPNYLSTARDRQTLIAGIRLARRLVATRALAPYVKSEYRPGPAAVTDDDLLEFAKNTGGTIFHPSGTCKMGDRGRDAMAVVDARLRVHGLEGLRVVDCSVMPTLTSGNTNIPVVMIAEKASDMILADAR